MNHKRTTISIILATVMLVSLFAVVSSAATVSGTVMAGTGPAGTTGVVMRVLVAVDTSRHVWWNERGWSSLGGSATSSPAATTPNLAVWGVFVRGTNGAVYEKTTTNDGASRGAWSNLGGQVAAGTGPAACSWSVGRFDVFVQGTDGACWYKEWTGTAWSSWKSLGGQLAPNTGPAGEVFVQGTDHQLWWKEFGEAGSAWRRLPACPEVLSASSPATSMAQSGHTEVWVSTTSGNLMGCVVSETWTGTAWVISWTWMSETSPP